MEKTKKVITLSLPVEIYDTLVTLATADYSNMTAYIVKLVRMAKAREDEMNRVKSP